MQPRDRRAFVHVCLASLAACALALAARAQEPAKAAFDQSHAPWTAVLKSCVRDGAFDYAKLKQDRSKLDAYLAALHAVTPQELAGWNEKQRLAFWINCYNAHCVEKVIEHYPLKSIRKLDGAFGMGSVFESEFIPMRAHHPEGKDADLALNDIENKILRAKFHDARIHAAINCAAKSCPPLRGEAFVAERLDAQLDEQMRAFVADPARNHIDPEKKLFEVSEIFKWFAEDFERDSKSVPAFLARFAAPDRADFVRGSKPRYIPYDWDLNDTAH